MTTPASAAQLYALVVFYESDLRDRDFEPAVTLCPSYDAAEATLRADFAEMLEKHADPDDTPATSSQLLDWLRSYGVHANIVEP